MKNIKLYTTTLIALMALAAPAFAQGGDVRGTEHPHHHMHKQGGTFKHDKAAFEKMHALHKKLHDVVVAEKFDKQAFLSLIAQIDQLRSHIERHHAEAFANKLAQMSPEERANLAEKFHEHMMMHHDGPSWNHGGWDHDGSGWGHKGWGHNNSWGAYEDHGDNGNWSHDAEENGTIDGREIPNH